LSITREPRWANQVLYRSAVKAEGLIYFFWVQSAMTNQFACKEQDRDLMSEACASGRLKIHVDDINGYPARRWHQPKLAQHLLAKAAPRA
jgi:hypothetical protein